MVRQSAAMLPYLTSEEVTVCGRPHAGGARAAGARQSFSAAAIPSSPVGRLDAAERQSAEKGWLTHLRQSWKPGNFWLEHLREQCSHPHWVEGRACVHSCLSLSPRYLEGALGPSTWATWKRQLSLPPQPCIDTTTWEETHPEIPLCFFSKSS